jgi:hypothetical protein
MPKSRPTIKKNAANAMKNRHEVIRFGGVSRGLFTGSSSVYVAAGTWWPEIGLTICVKDPSFSELSKKIK